ncbi:ABC transporter permease [Haloglycomyces albus]|uniref:ABC transporter permease n=1 Tax=Haloglycomyces albus TaxID=526067 RepID=UPI00046D79E1|nr:ABC transporter permease [Haloglycomyces albus]
MTLLTHHTLRSRWQRPAAMLNRNLFAYRRQWILVASGGIEALLFLFAFGFGVGSLVGTFTLPSGREVEYTAYVAPAILANAAMMGVLLETSINVFAKTKWMKIYDGILNTPLRPWDIALGEVAWAMVRGSIYIVMFVAAMGAFGLLNNVWAILAIPACLFISLAFSGIGLTLATLFRDWTDFDWLIAVVYTMFLFGGTFIPVETYPEAVKPIVYLMPLYHGIEMVRSISLATVGPMILVHIGYLILLAVGGIWIAQKRLAKTLYD